MSDKFVVPLCRIHHRSVQRVGNEAAWWKEAYIDPIKVARKLRETDSIYPKAAAGRGNRLATTTSRHIGRQSQRASGLNG